MQHKLNLQPCLYNNLISLSPLQKDDFEALYAVANDPKIWEQHPNKNRYQRAAFENYFNGAIQSQSAFLVRDAVTNNIIGCSRYYNFDANTHTIFIGYTFIACAYWGKGYNQALKKVMLNYIFKYVHAVQFQVGGHNVRSQMAMQKIGGVKIDEQHIAYFGETETLNYIYEIKKQDWINKL
jgi:N-acetyltransferase